MRIVSGCLLVGLVACGGGDPEGALVEGPAESEIMPMDQGESRELARFDAAGNAVEIHEFAGGGLLIAELGTNGVPSRLDGLVGELSLSELYSEFVEGAVPEALSDYDRRVPAHVREGLSELEQEGGARQRLMHEAGSEHFRDSHCPADPSKIWMGTEPVAVRSFCWAQGYISGHTESANAGHFMHEITSVSGPICYTAKDDETSRSFEIPSGYFLRVWRTNNYVGYNVPCPRGAVCSGVGLPGVARMSGAVGCASGNTWRFGGTFWKPNPRIYTPSE